ncbi:LysR family transcriptional regulator [Tumebacillus flagellatus]|uniref:LysR family transcriptional regulator n=1 Tax=Tumebacillus flagellatus TaxID=1157490 RepID=A0A074MDU2_9BACL|nr:LysR family transcriptional regulator [Tumebacillus flagellatus]KEO84007.1 LysR family transcriptional regulator [Tumebacillus flagellatus]
MESQELRIFRAVAYEGSITKAAQTLGYVQSNVTARVQQLEAELDTQLFYRHRGMILTPAGQKLLAYADQVIRLLDEAQAALHDSLEPSGPLSLGANPAVSVLHLPELLAHYHKLYPKVELSLTTQTSEELLQKIRQFQLDGAFIKMSVREEQLAAELIYEEELVLITQPDIRDVQEVCKQPFLMNTAGCPHREELETWFKSIGQGSVRYLEFNHLDATIQGVVSGLGASFVPKSAIQKLEESGVLRSFSLPSQPAFTQIYFVRNPNSFVTSALDKFLELLRKNPLYGKKFT